MSETVPSNGPSTLRSAAQWAAVGALTAMVFPVGTLVSLVRPGASLPLFSLWDRLAQRLFGVRVEVEDRNRGQYDAGPYVFVQLNQRSLAETFIAHDALPLPLLLFTNIEYALLPLIGWGPWLSGAVIVVRQWERQRRRALDRAVEKVRRGRSFYMSIEGARSPDGRLLPYKKGPVLLAIRGGATIIPVVYEGAERVLPYGEWRVRPGRVRVKLLEAIPTRGLGVDDRDALVRRLEALARREVPQPEAAAARIAS